MLDRPLASVRIVDLREEYAAPVPMSCSARPSRRQSARGWTAGDQTLLLLNRRGYATSVLCRQCGHILECPNCSVTLTVHRRAHGPSRAVCHYCNYSMRVPGACVKCAAPYLEQLGFGTDRVLTEVERLLPGIRAGRVDRDTMQKRGAIQDVLARFGRGELDMLVGTQMIAKGHDFPLVTLVGVVSADLGLGLPDFRAAERTFQLLTQVAGRAGRGAQAGEAIIQTFHPDHYSIQLATRQDYDGFFKAELRYRKAMAYPPVVGLVSLVVVDEPSRRPCGRVGPGRPPSAGRPRRLRGPRACPAPLAKLRGEHRAQIFLKTAPDGDAGGSARGPRGAPELRRRVTVDVDPMGML